MVYLDESNIEDYLVISVKGNIQKDPGIVSRLYQHINGRVNQGNKKVVLDLSRAENIDTGIAGIVMSTYDTINAQGGSFRFIRKDIGYGVLKEAYIHIKHNDNLEAFRNELKIQKSYY